MHNQGPAIYKGDYVTLVYSGGIWRVERVDPMEGYAPYENLLTLQHVHGGRPITTFHNHRLDSTVKFGSAAVRKLNEIEVLAKLSETAISDRCSGESSA